MRLGLLAFTLLLGVIMQPLHSDQTFAIPADIQGKPFKAQYEQVLSKKSPDGQISKQVITGVIYRASDGRSRKESYVETQPGVSEGEILIYDPIKQTIFYLDTVTKTFISMPSPATESSDKAANSSVQTKEFPGDKIGHKTIEGLECQGYRTHKSDGGSVEYWVSEDLLEVVLAETKEANQESVMRLFNISRTEPDSGLFNVPIQYRELTPP